MRGFLCLIWDLCPTSTIICMNHSVYLKGGQVDYGVQDNRVLAFASSEPWKEEVKTITFQISIVCNSDFDIASNLW